MTTTDPSSDSRPAEDLPLIDLDEPDALRRLVAILYNDVAFTDRITDALSNQTLTATVETAKLTASVKRLLEARTPPTGRAFLWNAMDEDHQDEAWAVLVDWLNDELTRHAPSLARTLGNTACWWRHADAVERLDGLRSAWCAAYRPSVPHVTGADRKREQEAADAAKDDPSAKTESPAPGDDTASSSPTEYLTRWLPAIEAQVGKSLQRCNNGHSEPTAIATIRSHTPS